MISKFGNKKIILIFVALSQDNVHISESVFAVLSRKLAVSKRKKGFDDSFRSCIGYVRFPHSGAALHIMPSVKYP